MEGVYHEAAAEHQGQECYWALGVASNLDLETTLRLPSCLSYFLHDAELGASPTLLSILKETRRHLAVCIPKSTC